MRQLVRRIYLLNSVRIYYTVLHGNIVCLHVRCLTLLPSCLLFRSSLSLPTFPYRPLISPVTDNNNNNRTASLEPGVARAAARKDAGAGKKAGASREKPGANKGAADEEEEENRERNRTQTLESREQVGDYVCDRRGGERRGECGGLRICMYWSCMRVDFDGKDRQRCLWCCI